MSTTEKNLADAFDPGAVLHDVTHLVGHIRRHLTNLRNELTPSQLERFSRVTEMLGRLNLICQTGLIGARMIQGRHSFKRLPLPIGPLLLEALETVRPLAAHGKVTILHQTETRPNVIMADPAHFPRILENLLLNAIEASPPGGQVVLKSESADGSIVVTISDEGPGFDDAIEGTKNGGFGLAVSRALVGLHEGELSFAHRKPRGSIASLRFKLISEVSA